MVQGDYNKHKQRTAVNKLRSFIDNVLNNPKLDSKLIDIGDGITVSRKIKEENK
jgi:predicted O-methyltransferase YrrM